MARLPRIVLPGLAHHVTQRGNGRQRVFFSENDYALYRRMITEACEEADVTCLAFCLMPNHAHLILVPATSVGLSRCLSRVHRAYARCLNARRNVTGHFWQGRYGSVPMDEPHLHEALRYVLMNPVRAGLATDPASWRWSSARVYLEGTADGLTQPQRMLSKIQNIHTYLNDAPVAERVARLRAAETIGRPAAETGFVRQLEAETRRTLLAAKRGRRPHVSLTPSGSLIAGEQQE